MTEASRVQQLLTNQNAKIDWLKNRNDKLETALRHYACGCKENECQVKPKYAPLKCGWPARQALGEER
jgi:hypothetical protein